MTTSYAICIELYIKAIVCLSFTDNKDLQKILTDRYLEMLKFQAEYKIGIRSFAIQLLV